jgi:hypothetical protein
MQSGGKRGTLVYWRGSQGKLRGDDVGRMKEDVRIYLEPSVLTHACNPSYSGSGLLEDQGSKLAPIKC